PGHRGHGRRWRLRGDRRVRAATARPDGIGRPPVPALADAVLYPADRAGGSQGRLPDLRVLRRRLARLHRSRTGCDRFHRARQDAAGVDSKPASRAFRHRDGAARDPAWPGQAEAAPRHPDRPAVPVTARAVLRGWPARLAGALVTAALAATACGGGAGVPGPPSAYLGTVADKPVPTGIADLPLTTDAGRPTSLGAWRGQVVVLADFLTLCQETCPLTTGNLLMMDRAVTAAGLGRRVRF